MPRLPDNFDLDALLAPCEGATPAGVDLREDFAPQSPYYRLRDARAEARAAEREADSDPDKEGAATPSWRTVRELGSRVLAERSKDLEVAAWLTESLVRTDGLVGLTAGATLIARLTETFWDADIFPRPDEDGMATRIAPVTGLNGEGGDGTLIQPLSKLALFRKPDGDDLLYYQYKDARAVAGIADTARRQARLAAGSIDFEELEKWARAAGQAPFGRLLREVDEAAAAWQAAGDALDAKAGADAPPTSKVRDLLADIRAAVAPFAPGDEAPAEGGAPAADGAQAVPGSGPVAAGRTVTREDMLRDLNRIAAWFRAAEPQSPMAYTLDEAVRRGRMSWPELLAEVVGDSSTRHAILSSLGIKPPEE